LEDIKMREFSQLEQIHYLKLKDNE